MLNLTLATLSLKGGAATGGALVQGLLVTGPATYYAAVLQLAVTAEEEEGRQAAVAALMQVPSDVLPLPVLLDSLLQVCCLLLLTAACLGLFNTTSCKKAQCVDLVTPCAVLTYSDTVRLQTCCIISAIAMLRGGGLKCFPA